MKKILHIVGARPNFMKADPVIRAMKKAGGFSQVLVHTGQHYDAAMSKAFFDDLGMQKPNINLGVGKVSAEIGRAGRMANPGLSNHRNRKSGGGVSVQQQAQIEQIMKRFEPVLLREKPDWVFVYGDVNSTVAAARVSSKHGIRIAHVESGLRSFDRSMPEELNRIETDQLADMLFVTEASGMENLRKEITFARARIHLVGNTMIDTVVRLLPEASRRWQSQTVRRHGEAVSGKYALVTLHRPSNVDNQRNLGRIMKQIDKVAKIMPVIFPVHPRTRAMLEEDPALKGQTKYNRADKGQALHLMPPLGYLDFLALQANASVVITDSGGIQEETSYLGIPCLTVRRNTERPVTIDKGTNQLCKITDIYRCIQEIIAKRTRGRKTMIRKRKCRIPRWDGKAAERIAAIMKKA